MEKVLSVCYKSLKKMDFRDKRIMFKVCEQLLKRSTKIRVKLEYWTPADEA